jgi:putative peptidoglycan lipid II flippase
MNVEQQRPRIIPAESRPTATTEHVMHKKSLMHKLLQVAGSTMGSRVLGIQRERLMMAYLQWGSLAESFITAWAVPNSLRKIFAEGALSAAFIPTLVKLVKEKRIAEANGLMSLGFLFFEGIVLVLCMFAMIFAPQVVWFMAPGFSEQVIADTVPLLRILMPFIFFISSSALLSGPLQAVNHFFVPAFSPILLNIIFIGALIGSMHYGWPVTYLCYFLILGGLLQLLWHVLVFFKLRFHFGTITVPIWHEFVPILAKFANCLVSMSIMEISLIVDKQFASLLGPGSIAVIYLANRFMGIPLGVFVTAFSTILLPHFARMVTYAPKRLSFYLYEATKFVFWITLPVVLLACFFSTKIFQTLFASDSFTPEKLLQTSQTLTVFMAGLFFFSMNRILLNLFYALHDTRTPALICVVATITNIGMNYIFMGPWRVQGLALATVLSGAVQMILSIWYLRSKRDFMFYPAHLVQFLQKNIMQIIVIAPIFVGCYYTAEYLIALYIPAQAASQLLNSWYFWLWTGPLCAAAGLALYMTRSMFGIRIYFLD